MLRSYLEAIFLRAGPGVLNLATLLLIGGWLAPAEYGSYSTIVATTGLVASFLFGPLTFGVVSQYAKLHAKNLSDKYESSLVSCVLLVALGAATLGVVGGVFGLVRWSWIGPTVSFGVYTAVQEILHARLALWAFGLAAFSQAAVFMVLALFWIRFQPEPAVALTAFAASYAIASVVSLLLCRIPAMSWPRASVLSGTVAVGGPYTVSVVSEYGLYLGMRYVIRYVDTAHSLGIFSFCVDIAQRLVGFLINVASFITVPMAFKVGVHEGSSAFRKMLVSGAVYASLLSLAALLAVLAVRNAELVPVLNGSLFDPVVFVIVSLAVIVNRLKKLLVDPVAMRARRAVSIAIGYAVSTPVTLVVGAIAMASYGSRSAEVIYLGGYVLAAIVTLLVLRRSFAVDSPTNSS